MQRVFAVSGKLVTAGILVGSLLFAQGVVAEDDWGLDLEVYGWLPIIEFESETGEKGKITRDDLLDNLDLAGFWAARVHKGKWSLSSDFVYFRISKEEDVPLLPVVPSLAELRKAGMQAWIISPVIGYTIHETDKQSVELYAGGRYLWIGIDATIDINPLLPGQPSTSKKESPSDSNWDGIIGVRGHYQLDDKWFIPYSVNAGTGQSDFTWEVRGALGYRFEHLDAVAGWRYLYYDIGSDTLLKTLDVNGPYVGAIFHW